MWHEIIKIKNINDKTEILETLSSLYTDEDFTGNNGEEFTWEEAIRSGFNSSQEYVIHELKESTLTGEKLILKFFSEWLDNDGYYINWDFESAEEEDGSYTCSVVAITED